MVENIIKVGGVGNENAVRDADPGFESEPEDASEEESEERWHTLLTRRRVAFLLDHGADPNTRDAEGNSVLLCCTRAGRADLVALLLGAGADVHRANDAGEHADVIALAHTLPPAQAKRMVALLLPAVQIPSVEFQSHSEAHAVRALLAHAPPPARPHARLPGPPQPLALRARKPHLGAARPRPRARRRRQAGQPRTPHLAAGVRQI